MSRRRRYQISGTVQGVGFRPFIHRQAARFGLGGFVYNTPAGVTVEIEGNPEAITGFEQGLRKAAPAAAVIAEILTTELNPNGEKDFKIVASKADGEHRLHITPDIATCERCLAELRDPANRRYRYPFINCTDCGPRLTIIRDIPYDRANTSMACFELCPACRSEYENPADRRFHAEPNACPVCGPKLRLLDDKGRPLTEADPLTAVKAALKAGKVAAIKGLGGFHLAVDASNVQAIRNLRQRKRREGKPLALMTANLATARRYAAISAEEAELLTTPQRPIVLCRRNASANLPPEIAPGLDNLGIMLPYTPLHHLLLEDFEVLVMTSANLSDEPICIQNREAISRLQGIADLFLVHDRNILVRCDDSIAFVAGKIPRLTRRSRGFAPEPLRLDRRYPPVLALGPQLKSTICTIRDDCAFLSPHIGDLETPEARDFFHESIALIKQITRSAPTTVACDLHPGYYSSLAAAKMDANIVQVQHHHAHIVSCLAENGFSGRVVGLALDGTGYGTDGRIWGGECLVCTRSGFDRAGQLTYFNLPGGDLATRQPWRIAAALLRDIYGEAWSEKAHILDLLPAGFDPRHLDLMIERKLNCFQTSSLGRLFDAAGVLCGLRRAVSFEGQLAMELETLAVGDAIELPIAFSGGEHLTLDPHPMIAAIVSERLRGTAPELLAAGFHDAIVDGFTRMATTVAQDRNLDTVALSGGCFQNRRLLEGLSTRLEQTGLRVLTHSKIPMNDGGIALGQAVCAAHRIAGDDI